MFRAALGETNVLEHHGNIDWKPAPRLKQGSADDEDPTGLHKLRRAAENWDVPVVVTTAVQFFESLYAARPSRCRKLHSLARSVVILDEAQTLPIHLLRPCLAAIDELAANYGASVVLCTATQPALKRQDGFAGGLDIPDDCELKPTSSCSGRRCAICLNMIAQRRAARWLRANSSSSNIRAHSEMRMRTSCSSG